MPSQADSSRSTPGRGIQRRRRPELHRQADPAHQDPVHFQSLKPNQFFIAKVPRARIEIEIRAISYWRHGTDRGGLLEGFSVRPAPTLLGRRLTAWWSQAPGRCPLVRKHRSRWSAIRSPVRCAEAKRFHEREKGRGPTLLSWIAAWT